MLRDVCAGLAFIKELKPYVREPLCFEQAEARIRQQLSQREEGFLRVLRQAVYGYAPSPYLALLRHAQIAYQDVEALVRQRGVESTLDRLYDEGIHITLDEFKGRAPIERPGLSLPVSSAAFDSPILEGAMTFASGGSGGYRRRLRSAPASLRYEAAYNLLYERAVSAEGMPFAQWRPILPGSAGIKDAMRQAMARRPVARWFSQVDPRHLDGHAVLTRLAVGAARAWGADIAMPRYVPADDAGQVARWLASQAAAGHPALISMTGSSAVRVCQAAEQLGVDITGTLFRLGGEPYTEARAEVIHAAGARAVTHYSMSELGRIGLSCGAPEHVDDVHLLSDKLALIQRPPRGTHAGDGLLAWHLTTLIATLPKIMLNVETGDYGGVEQRDCGCLLGQLGLSTHLHTIRSYEKLTTEGMHFTASALLHLVEEELPRRFGGAPGDYQLVEHQSGGVSRVLLVVSPRVGALDEAAVVATALRELATDAGTRMMASHWERVRTLRVVRREPYVTAAAKIQPLHIERSL